MNTTTKKIGDYEQEVTVEYDAAELEKAKKRACKQLSERTTIPGFRKGKVPPTWVIEQHLGKGIILDEAADILIQQAANDLIDKQNIVPVTKMKQKIITCEDGQPFVCTLTFTPYPAVTLGDYKNLSVAKTVEPVTDEQINEQLEHLRTHHADMVDAADAAVADGDFITLDFEGSVDGEKFEGGTAQDYPLEIGSHSFIGDFEQQLIGSKIGDELDVKVTFPDNYHAKNLAGKPAVFHCKINSIKHRVLPELDDAFAKKASKFETLDEFKADIRKNMEAGAERRASDKQIDDAVELAANNMTVDIPPVMIDNKIDQLINELSANLQTRGMTLEQYLSVSGLDMDALRDTYRDAAAKAVRTDILLDEVARAENITVTNEELNIELQYMAAMYRTNPKQIYKVLQENGQVHSLISTVLRRKTMKFIVDNMAKDEPAADAETVAADTVAAETAADADEKTAAAAETPSTDDKPAAKSAAQKAKTAAKKSK